MRLIHVKTYQLVEFLESDVPPYAILSHTWAQDEVSYQDMQKLRAAKKKAGFAKIVSTCEEASLVGVKYAWVDTCCIDKTSSAELQEAINSMYRWYAEAHVCFAYLADVSQFDWRTGDYYTLRKSKWFTRGWTLQELIAPQQIRFYARDWSVLFDGSDMVALLSNITKVDPAVLRHEARLSTISIAKRMSWAAYRQTSRTEDMAYCLLGLFEVSIPMLYGEGKRSFRRLQEEIIRTSSDHSIFAWGLSLDRTTSDLLASSPADFAGGHEIVSWGRPGQYEMTNRGLRINLPVLQQQTPLMAMPWGAEKSQQEYLGILNCRLEQSMDTTLALRMQRLRDEEEYVVSSHRYMNIRIEVVSLDRIAMLQPSLVSIAREFQAEESPVRIWFRLADARSPLVMYDISRYFPDDSWTGSVMRRRPAHDNMVPGQLRQAESDIEAGVACWLWEPTDVASGTQLSCPVMFLFGYSTTKNSSKALTAAGDDQTWEADYDLETGTVGQSNTGGATADRRPKLSPTMAIAIAEHYLLPEKCSEKLRCPGHSEQCITKGCPFATETRKLRLPSHTGGEWLLTMDVRERSIMGETTLVIDATISKHFEVELRVPAVELEATEWTGRTPMYHRYDPEDYPSVSRLRAWRDARDLLQDLDAMFGSFAMLVSDLTTPGQHEFSWDDIMGDKEVVELDANGENRLMKEPTSRAHASWYASVSRLMKAWEEQSQAESQPKAQSESNATVTQQQMQHQMVLQQMMLQQTMMIQNQKMSDPDSCNK